MWPWGHAAVGYLLYLGVTRRQPRIPLLVFVALGVGTQFPDLIDKPLAWTFSVLPSGRTLTHSALTASALITVLYTVSVNWQSRSRETITAFTIGYTAHLLGDAIHPLLTGSFEDLTWLLWPILPSPTYDTGQSFLAHFRALSIEPMTLVGFTLTALAATLWLSRLYRSTSTSSRL